MRYKHTQSCMLIWEDGHHKYTHQWWVDNRNMRTNLITMNLREKQFTVFQQTKKSHVNFLLIQDSNLIQNLQILWRVKFNISIVLYGKHKQTNHERITRTGCPVLGAPSQECAAPPNSMCKHVVFRSVQLQRQCNKISWISWREPLQGINKVFIYISNSQTQSE